MPDRLRRLGARLVAGDRVRLEAGDAPVAAVLPRTATLRRNPTPRTEHPFREDLTVAANLDVRLVVQACQRPSSGRSCTA